MLGSFTHENFKVYRPRCLLKRFLWILWGFFSQENMILIFFIWSHQFQIGCWRWLNLAGHEGSRYNLRWPHLWQNVDWGMAESKQYFTNHRHLKRPMLHNLHNQMFLHLKWPSLVQFLGILSIQPWWKGLPLLNKTLIPNHSLRKLIQVRRSIRFFAPESESFLEKTSDFPHVFSPGSQR